MTCGTSAGWETICFLVLAWQNNRVRCTSLDLGFLFVSSDAVSRTSRQWRIDVFLLIDLANVVGIALGKFSCTSVLVLAGATAPNRNLNRRVDCVH